MDASWLGVDRLRSRIGRRGMLLSSVSCDVPDSYDDNDSEDEINKGKPCSTKKFITDAIKKKKLKEIPLTSDEWKEELVSAAMEQYKKEKNSKNI